MSAKKNPKEKIPVYETLSEWDEVLQGDEELFREMTEPYISTLHKSARTLIRQERFLGTLTADAIQSEELVAETLIQAWNARHGRSLHEPVKRWLLRIQEQTMRKMIAEEEKLHAPIVASLEAPAPHPSQNIENDENELWRLFEPRIQERWEDIIPDESAQSLAA